MRDQIPAEEAARRKGVTCVAVRRAVISGKLCGGKVNGRVWVDPLSLADWEPKGRRGRKGEKDAGNTG